jgi:hypothetical protein
VAAVLLGETPPVERILEQGEPETRAALLAAARLAGVELPLAAVGDLLATPGEAAGGRGEAAAAVAHAAELYLLAQDGPQARRLLLAAHPGEALILGRRLHGDPGHVTYAHFDEVEEKLRRRVRTARQPVEIFAMLTASYWGSDGDYVIEVRPKRTVARFAGKPCQLAPAALERLRSFVRTYRVEDLGPLDTAVFDGIQYEYVHLTRDGGRRVFMNNPGSAGGSVYDVLTWVFYDLDCS